MIDLAYLLPRLLRTGGANIQLAVKLAWARVAGEGLRRHAIPFRLDERTLIVSVADAIWQKQLQSMAGELVLGINRFLEQSVIDFIDFRVDPVALNQVRTGPEQRRLKMSSTPAPIEIVSAAESIADQDLRKQFVRAAENCIARRDAQLHDGIA